MTDTEFEDVVRCSSCKRFEKTEDIVVRRVVVPESMQNTEGKYWREFDYGDFATQRWQLVTLCWQCDPWR